MESAPFGIALRRQRVAAGLSQEALAEQAGVSVRSIIGLENGGGHQPRPVTIQLIAEALNLSAQEKSAWFALIAAPEPVRRPEPTDSLFGRAADCAAVEGLIRQQSTQLITICGLGGIGKTCLAQAVAERIAPSFRDGMGWVALDALREPDDVPQAVLNRLKLPSSPHKDPRAVLRAALRKREMLIVLDNFEHLLPAAEFLVDLLATCPSVTWLVTSRVLLRLRAEQVFTLDLLALPPGPSADIEQIAASPAVALFVARCQRHNPTFMLTTANAQAVAGICRTLDGIPLALELAAARSNLFTPTDLLSHLHSRLDFLTQGARDLPARQQTLRATLDWNYLLLAAPDQCLFRRLAVFAGGIPIEAVATICARSPAAVIEGLATLTEHSLIHRVPGTTARVAMLETVREYASEQSIAHQEHAEVQRLHATYFLAWAEEVEPQARGPEQQFWLNRLEEELPNIRLALDWAERHNEIELGLRIVIAAWRMWYQRGYLVEGRHWLDLLFNAPGMARVDLRWRANAASVAGWLAFGQGDYAEAAAQHERCLTHRRALQDTSGIASTLNNLGGVARMQGELRRAEDLFTEAFAMYRALNEIDGMGRVLHNLAAVAWALGKADDARHWCEASLALAHQTGQIALVASCHEGFGILAYDQGDYETALEHFTAYRQMAGDIGEGRALVLAHLLLGKVYLAFGEIVAAQEAFQHSLDLATERTDEAGSADAHLGLGWVAVLTRDSAGARQHLSTSLTIFARLESRSELAATLDAIAYYAVFVSEISRPQLATRLLMVAETLRAEWGITVPPLDAARVRQVKAQVSEHLAHDIYPLWEGEHPWSLAEATAAARDFLARAPARHIALLVPARATIFQRNNACKYSV